MARHVFRPARFALVLCVAAAVVWATPVPSGASGLTTSRLSVSSSGAQAYCPSSACGSGATYTAGKGRFVVFESTATNLTSLSNNGVSQIYLRDRALHKTRMVSVSSRGRPGNGPSHSARGVSPDGRFITFESIATNLATGDTNGAYDVFLRDRKLGKTYLVSRNSKGHEGNGASADPVVSADGRFVAFEAEATNLVSPDANGAMADVYLRDRRYGKTYRISVSSSGRQGANSSSDPSMSPNGRFIVFESRAGLAKNDTSAETSIYLRDRKYGKTSLASVNSSGIDGNAGSYSARVSPDGRYVAFESFSSNLAGGPDNNHAADVYLRDRNARKTYLISRNSKGQRGNAFSSDPAISANARFVAFESAATNLAPGGDTNAHVDVFVRDRWTHRTRCVSVNRAGHPGNAGSENPWVSADGRWIVFASNSSNLVSGDTNGVKDIFIRGPYA